MSQPAEPAALWTFAADTLRQGRPAILVVVVDCSGSVPGKTGAKLVVSSEECHGTIGGGVAESRLIDRARAHTGGTELVSFDHTPASGSLCAGSQTFAVLQLAQRHLPVLESIITTISDGRHGSLTLSVAGPAFTSGTRTATNLDRGDGDTGWRYQETLGNLDTLYIIGGGHVSLALSRVMATLPFRIVVIDNRPELPTMQRNSFAHETHVIPYDRVAEQVPEGELSWVVIMTFGHLDDEAVLEQLVNRRYRYLGMMGSPVKVRQIFDRLRQRGVSDDALQRVCSPVGVAIGSHSPAEIAISIAAEIIKLRNTGDDPSSTL